MRSEGKQSDDLAPRVPQLDAMVTCDPTSGTLWKDLDVDAKLSHTPKTSPLGCQRPWPCGFMSLLPFTVRFVVGHVRAGANMCSANAAKWP